MAPLRECAFGHSIVSPIWELDQMEPTSAVLPLRLFCSSGLCLIPVIAATIIGIVASSTAIAIELLLWGDTLP
jgi:hypothetical protein